MKKEVTRREFMMGLGLGVTTLLIPRRTIIDWVYGGVAPAAGRVNGQIVTLTDYKFSEIHYLDDGSMRVKVRFYEGVISELLEDRGTDPPELVTRYRRSGIVKRPVLHFDKMTGVTAEEADSGNAIILTSPSQRIRTILRSNLNEVLERDTTRTPVDEQKTPR